MRDPHTMKMVVLVHSFSTAYLVRRRVKTRLRISANVRDPHTMKMVVLVHL